MSQNNKKKNRSKNVQTNDHKSLPSSKMPSVSSLIPGALSRLPPGETIDYFSNMLAASRSMGGSFKKWPEIKKSLDKDGFGEDLVEVTTRLWPDPVTFFNRLSLIHEHKAMSTIPGHVKSGVEERGKGGMKCERVGCATNNPDKRPNLTTLMELKMELKDVEDAPKPVLKRCLAVRHNFSTRIFKFSKFSRP